MSNLGKLLFASGFLFAFSTKVFATCNSVRIDLVGLPNASDPLKAQPKAQLFLQCMGDTPYIPGTTLLQTVREVNGKMCYSDMACGNALGWSGYVAVAGTWIFFDSVLTFVTSQQGKNLVSANRDFNGQNTGLQVGIEWGQVLRSCEALSEEICM